MPSKNYLFLLLGSFLLCSILSVCSSPDSKKEAFLAYALNHAGNNRAQWTAVLDHYAADSLKSEATRFLIRNLPAKGYLTGPALDEFHAFIDSVYQIPQEECDETVIYRDYRRKARFSGEPLVYHADLKEMQAIDLIRPIGGDWFGWMRRAGLVLRKAPMFKYTSVAVSPSRPYRYLSSAQTQGNMAEVVFREAQTDTVLKGRIIGTDKTSIYHPEAVKENVFDGDGLTYFHTRDSLSGAGLGWLKQTYAYSPGTFPGS